MVLAWAAAGLALGAVVLGARWWRNPYDVLGQRRALPLTALLSLELAVLALVPVTRLMSEDRRLGRIASELAGTPAAVRCQPLSHAMVDVTGDLGHVNMVDGRMGHTAYIKNEQCRLIARYAAGDQAHPSHEEVVAVHVLTHESMHIRGQADEAKAECAAMQRDADTARALGATDEQGRMLAERYWREDYPWMPDGYRTSDCVPGGRLDEHLPDPPW